MKMKKLVSAIAALAMSVSAFAGIAITAQAATTTLYERGYETAWTADDVTAWGADELTTDYGLHKTGGNGDNAATMTITPEANSIINVEAQWIGMSNTGRSFSNGNGSYFRFGNTYVLQNDQDQKWGYTIDAANAETACKSLTLGSSAVNTYRGNYDISTKNWYVISMEVDTAANILNYLKIYSSANPTVAIVDVANQTLSGTDYSTLAFGYEKSGGVSTTNNEYLKSIKVTQTTQTVSTADYTINYTLTGETTPVKTVTSNGVVGNTIEAETVFTEDGVKYYATDDATTSMILESGTNVLDVEIREANKYTVTVNNAGSISGEVTTIENIVEGESATYYCPRYIVEGEKLHQVVLSAYNRGYAITLSNVTEDNKTITVTYAEVADATVVYCSEAEDIEGMSVGDDAARLSGGKGGYASADVTITTLPAGEYTIMTGSRRTTSNGSYDYNISAGNDVVLSGYTDGSFAEINNSFTLTETADITIGAGGDGRHLLDYVVITKTGDVEDGTTLWSFKGIEIANFADTSLWLTVNDTDNYSLGTLTQLAETVVTGGGTINFDIAIVEDTENEKVTAVWLDANNNGVYGE